jgi:hypothetical protein
MFRILGQLRRTTKNFTLHDLLAVLLGIKIKNLRNTKQHCHVFYHDIPNPEFFQLLRLGLMLCSLFILYSSIHKI